MECRRIYSLALSILLASAAIYPAANLGYISDVEL
jgi:hypothetical protein